MPDPVQEVGAMFPIKGVDVTCEYGRQPEDTTPVGANVRAFEPGSERGRGGSRAGLTKYVPATVNGATPVQHLAILIDPQAPALNADNFTEADAPPGYIPDPSTNNLSDRNNGRYIPPEGSGRQPNRQRPQNGFIGTRDIRFTLVTDEDGSAAIEYQWRVPGAGSFSAVITTRMQVAPGVGDVEGHLLVSSTDYDTIVAGTPPFIIANAVVTAAPGGAFNVALP